MGRQYSPENTKLSTQQAGELQNGTLVHGVLKGTNLFCYWRSEDADTGQEPLFTIVINKVTSPSGVRPPGAWAQAPLSQDSGGLGPGFRDKRKADSVPKSTKPTTGPGIQRYLLPTPPYPQTMMLQQATRSLSIPSIPSIPQHPQPLPNPRGLFLGSSSFSSSSLCFQFVLLVTCCLSLQRYKRAALLPSPSLAFLCVCFALSSAGVKSRDSCFKQVPYPSTAPQTPPVFWMYWAGNSDLGLAVHAPLHLPCPALSPFPVSTCSFFPASAQAPIPTMLAAPPSHQS